MPIFTHKQVYERVSVVDYTIYKGRSEFRGVFYRLQRNSDGKVLCVAFASGMEALRFSGEVKGRYVKGFIEYCKTNKLILSESYEVKDTLCTWNY